MKVRNVFIINCIIKDARNTPYHILKKINAKACLKWQANGMCFSGNHSKIIDCRCTVLSILSCRSYHEWSRSIPLWVRSVIDMEHIIKWKISKIKEQEDGWNKLPMKAINLTRSWWLKMWQNLPFWCFWQTLSLSCRDKHLFLSFWYLF